MVCKYLGKCIFFNNHLADNPQKVHELMEKFCKGNYKNCARYVVISVLGEKAVPEKLYPDMRQVALQLIAKADRMRKENSSNTNTLINSLKADDIFDFALDLITESSKQLSDAAYSVHEQMLRKFILWMCNELQNNYAYMIQLKLKTTGIRSRKRGKNPLTLFIENTRRNQRHKKAKYNVQNVDGACELYFSSIKVRVALFKGLKSKPLSAEVLKAINVVLTVEEERSNIGNDKLLSLFKTQNT